MHAFTYTNGFLSQFTRHQTLTLLLNPAEVRGVTEDNQQVHNMDGTLILRGIYLGAAASVRGSHIAMSNHG